MTIPSIRSTPGAVDGSSRRTTSPEGRLADPCGIGTHQNVLPQRTCNRALCSVGHWDRDVFVVETAGFNDKTALDQMGNPHSEVLRVTEHYHHRDFGQMDVE
jgi:hypothetical protein